MIECPRCKARLIFCRSRTADIDSAGFESYGFKCHACDAHLAGIVDPYDEAVLLSVLERGNQ